MNIQSISIVVPTKGCINKCKFCVSRMHDNPYEDKFNEIAYRKRIKRAVIDRVNTCILTGTGEALQNTKFLEKLLDVLNKEHHPFPNVELQTSGVMLMDKIEAIPGSTIRTHDSYPKIELLKKLGVNTISLSVSDIFDSDNNWDIIGSPEKYQPSLVELCQFIKFQGFNLRLSLNMTNVYNDKTPKEILQGCQFLGADQITFRQLYHSNDGSEQSKWVIDNACKESVIEKIAHYIAGVPMNSIARGNFREDANGKPLYRLPFGAMVYSIMGMSVAIDDNCMSKNDIDNLKYVILRENGKLYCQWDDEGSLIF
ncbi:MAG TPA: radical SAM protein [Candidatus Glassbacteria bacterium]|nr:radical SAM protein [Candidatus Glassbacteria bacterium]